PVWGHLNAASDLAGGLLVTWPTSSPASMHIQRLNPNAYWVYGFGTAFGDAIHFQDSVPVGDGSGGAWVVWNEESSPNVFTGYAVHISSDGGTPPSSRGVGITSSSTSKWALLPIRDATGGCFVYFFTFTGSSLLRQQIDTAGNLLGQV